MKRTIAELMAEEGWTNGPYDPYVQLHWAAERIFQMAAELEAAKRLIVKKNKEFLTVK